MPKRYRQRKLALRDPLTVRLKADFVIPAGTVLEVGAVEAYYAEPTYEAQLAFAGAESTGYLTLDEEILRAYPDMFEIEEVAR